MCGQLGQTAFNSTPPSCWNVANDTVLLQGVGRYSKVWGSHFLSAFISYKTVLKLTKTFVVETSYSFALFSDCIFSAMCLAKESTTLIHTVAMSLYSIIF